MTNEQIRDRMCEIHERKYKVEEEYEPDVQSARKHTISGHLGRYHGVGMGRHQASQPAGKTI